MVALGPLSDLGSSMTSLEWAKFWVRTKLELSKGWDWVGDFQQQTEELADLTGS
jgi:hypothetical protein